MAKKISVDVDVNTSSAEDKIEGLGAQIRRLKKELRNTPEGTAEWKSKFQEIDELEDKLKGSRKASADLFDTLEGAGGPLGQLGKALNTAKQSTVSFGAALKATGIGLIVAAIGGLVAAFAETEGAMKKLDPIIIAFQKILGGIFEALTPLIDGFVELATQALPYVTQGIKVFYSSLVALFTLVKEGGGGIAKILKGIFTLDKKAIQEGYEQLTGTWQKTVESFEATEKRFDEGYKKRTKREKEIAKDNKELADKALEEKLKRLEAEDKLDEAQLNKLKEEALALAQTEQEKLDVEKKFAKLSYDAKVKDIEDKQKLYKKDSVEYKTLQAEKIAAEGDYINKTTGFTEQQKKINEDLLAQQKAYQEKKSEILNNAIKNEVEKAKAERKSKYDKDLADLEADKEFIKKSETEKAELRAALLQGLNNDIAKIEKDAQLKKIDDEIKLVGFRNDTLLAGTKAYFAGRRELLDLEEKKELAALDLTEAQKTAIKKKYAKLREDVDKDEIASYGQTISATMDALATLGNAIASSYDEEAKTSKKAFEERKKIQKATALMSAASGIIQILTQPSTLPSPFDWIVKGVNAAALAVATAVQIKNIDRAQFEGSGGSGAGATAAIPTYGGAPAAMASPQLNVAQQSSPNQQIAQTLAQAANRPIKAYVVSSDVSNQQQLDRRTNRGATFQLG